MKELFEAGVVKWAVVALTAFLCLQSLGTLLQMRYIGSGGIPTNTISISGYGEAFAVADVATFSFTVSSKKATVAAAQEDATAKINTATAYLVDAGVDKKDIKTTDYSVYPQYEYRAQACPAGGYCPGGTQVLTGYEVRQTTSVKARDTAKAGDLLAGVGSKGATEVSGLDFTFDDPNKLQTEARGKAISDAKQKADALAKQLGVRLVRIVSYNDNGRYPIYYAKAEAASYSIGGGGRVTPEIPVGEDKIISQVNITYEIK